MMMEMGKELLAARGAMTCASAMALTLMALAAAPARAQEQPVTASPSSAQATDQQGTADIIVTAQRRGEELSKTPVSVAVVSADTLARANIKTEDDLRSVLPGVTIRSTSNSNQINYAIRGQSKDAFSGTRPGVLPYFNEVQIGGDGSTSFYDLQSIQALSGPQGTLFGRSATGGAVLLTSAKPVDTLEGYASGLAGNYGALKFEGALNVPLAGDHLMARVAGFYEKRDGYQTNLLTNEDVGKVKRWGIRGSLSANLGIVHNDLVVDYYRSDSQNTVSVLSGLQTNGTLLPIAALYSGTATPVATATGIAVLTAFVPPAFAPLVPAYYNGYFSTPNHPNVGLAGFLAQQQARGPFQIFSDAANFYRAHNIIVTNGTTIDVGDNLKLRNIFGYVKLKTALGSDYDGSPYGINGVDNYRLNTRQVSEELQLQGAALDENLKFTVGGYFSDERQDIINSSVSLDIIFGGAPFPLNNTTFNKTYAAYGQGTYNLNDNGLAVTAGLRYTSERVRLLINPGDISFAFANTPGYSVDQSATYNKLSWQIGLQDQVSNNLLVYVVSRRAYKSGGFNSSTAPKIGGGAVGGSAYDAERVTDLELGSKLNGRIGNIPARLAASLYYTWGQNGQRTSYTLVAGNPATVTVNVPKSRIYGAEFQATIQPATWLSLGGSFNYFHGEISGATNGATPLAGCNGATVNSNSNLQCFDQFTDTPKASGSLFTDITVPVTSRLDALLHGDVYLQSKSQTAPQSSNAAGTEIGGYALANFRLGLEDKEAGWSLTANLKNAFNRVYYVGGLPSALLIQLNNLIPGAPRTFSLEARLKF